MKLVKALSFYILFMFAMAVVGLPIFVLQEYKPEWLAMAAGFLRRVRENLIERKV